MTDVAREAEIETEGAPVPPDIEASVRPVAMAK
jgi:hypothetical protein